MTLRNFSASVSCRDGVSITFEADEVTEPVGLDFLVSCGERQNPVTFLFKRKKNTFMIEIKDILYIDCEICARSRYCL